MKNRLSILIFFIPTVFGILIITGCGSILKPDQNSALGQTETTNNNDEDNYYATLYPTVPLIAPTDYPIPLSLGTSFDDSSLEPPLKIESEGTGTISGELFSVSNNAPIPKTMFFLISAVGEEHDIPSIITGPRKDDLLYYTNGMGKFIIYNIKPGFYYLVMSAPPYDWAIGFQNTSNLEPLLIEVKPNEIIPLDRIIIYWP